jgi:hypothetical protein
LRMMALSRLSRLLQTSTKGEGFDWFTTHLY